MNFLEYCQKLDDKQSVGVQNSLILEYSNKTGKIFNIDAESIKRFLEFFIDEYPKVYSAWETVDDRKPSIDLYHEDSYRAIYKSANTENLKIIYSSGSSQTSATTGLISKIIAFLTGNEFIKLEENTFFTEHYIKKALDSWDNLFVDSNKNKNNEIYINYIKNKFKKWLNLQGLSEKTIVSYSEDAMKYNDGFLKRVGINKSSIYALSSTEISDALSKFKDITDWKKTDTQGNGMYSSACNKLIKFLNSTQIFEVPLYKSFLLLAGISGTGKTRFVREQAKASGTLGETYCLTSVRPDWHEPSDLLGYVSRLSGQTEFVTTDVLQFIAKAWRAIADSALELKSHDDFGMTVEGERSDLQMVLPYWLCLDEMNLAPVEQYFADYLSVLETRQWIWTDDSFSYNCDPLLKPSVFMELGDSAKQGLRRSLGFEDERYSDIWDLITTHGLGLPFNLIVAGTVNMDETTHGFSRKVIDRALSFDFGEFFPNNFGSFFAPDTQAKTLSYPLLSQVNSVDLQESCDPDGSKSVNFLDAVNDVLRSTPFELAYRALNELLLAVACQKPSDEVELQAVWDDFMMCKVLPRIEGDTDKLGSDPSLLNKLSDLLSKHLDSIWIDQSGTTLRPDLYREKVSGDDKLIKVPCRSRTKLEWMTKRLTQSGFTSFWP